MMEMIVGVAVFAAFFYFGLLGRHSRRKLKATLSATFAATPAAIPNTNAARILWVLDGDTVDVMWDGAKTRLRLDAIDCPEGDQPWGHIAKAGLIKLIAGKDIRLESHGLDKYGRTLATIFVWNASKKDWMNVNERMVMLGHAWVMRAYYAHLPKERQNSLNKIERWSRSRKVGLWNTLNPIPPWEWRHRSDSVQTDERNNEKT